MSNSEGRKHIVCAARGGRRIQPSVERAIELACETGAHLTFLYVLDVEFLKHATTHSTGTRLGVMFDELDKMGEFMMLRLCEYAAESGCAESDYVIRHGKLREEIVKYLEEAKPDLLVLGRPRHEPEHEAPPAFETDAIALFAHAITEKTGVEVELV